MKIHRHLSVSDTQILFYLRRMHLIRKYYERPFVKNWPFVSFKYLTRKDCSIGDDVLPKCPRKLKTRSSVQPFTREMDSNRFCTFLPLKSSFHITVYLKIYSTLFKIFPDNSTFFPVTHTCDQSILGMTFWI